MQNRQLFGQKQQSSRLFTASEVAEYEYCPLAWWYEKHEPLVAADTEELFATMVEMEQERGPQATALPEYQVIEQLLVRRGAFEEGRLQHEEHAEAVAAAGITDFDEIAEERTPTPGILSNIRQITMIITVLAAMAVLFILASFLLH